ncbi:MAG TPA: L,D-transpeptidase [Thermoanaerobaculia bacterium]|nr:L,D-transpeptidase [Thermoanaerobaculia bacterium]
MTTRTARAALALATLLMAAPALVDAAFLAKGKKRSSHSRRHKRATRPKPAGIPIAPTTVNNPATAALVARGASGGAVLRAQILLDRARFSPGEIDAACGTTMQRAVAGFQKAHGAKPNGVVDHKTWKLLNADTAPALVRYAIRPEDVAGPFLEVPEDMMEKATLPALGYANALEGIAEKFHTSPKLLTRLNRGKSFDRAGEKIVVPSVRTSDPPPKAAKVVVDKTNLTVTAFGADDKVLAQYPATMGSEHDPLPIGNWKVNGVSKNPPFHYNPDLFWDAEAKDEKTTIQPGPNNPVGVVWIDLSKSHYGIHGTPEPSTVGKTQSHGCIRLTNWDAAELAAMVTPGTPAILKE